MFITDLSITKIRGTKYWLLDNPLHWDGDITVHVPAGFKTDLTTKWFEGVHTEASVIHDYLLKEGYPWAVANEMMRQAMIDLGVHPFRRRLIMIGITLNAFCHEVF